MYDITAVSRFWSKVNIGNPDECWEWQRNTDKDGYGIFKFNGRNIRSPRFSYILAYGEIPPGMLICHSCDNPPCVNPAHLWAGTTKDNAHDMVEKGRYRGGGKGAKGTKNSHAKLSEDDVREIRRLFSVDKISKRALAKMFAVTRIQIRRIVTGNQWSHI